MSQAIKEFDWNNPNYHPIFVERYKRLVKLREGGHEGLRNLNEFYKTHPIEFIQDWFLTYDPRRKPQNIPFLLFPKQAEFITYLWKKYEDQDDGLVEKSRDMGLTWLCAAFAAWLWRYHDSSKCGFGSRKESLVDKLGDLDSIFEKIRYLIRNLPEELQPLGYVESEHANFMKIRNPENNSIITGEGGDNIGRGGRNGIYFKDEAGDVDSNVVTPNGYKRLGDIVVGDKISGSDGKPQTVTGINEVGHHETYTVKFSDGSKIKATPNHIWTVDKVWGKKKRLNIRTHELSDKFSHTSPKGQTQYIYRVPQQSITEFSRGTRGLPLDPYLVGCLIGDGCVSGGCIKITSADNSLIEELKELVPTGYSINKDSKYSYRIVSALGKAKGHRGGNHKVIAPLKDLGLYGCKSADKFIPREYLYSSPSERFSLLQGLMDTDGSASASVTTYHTGSNQLSKDVKFLVESLGGVASERVAVDNREDRYLDMNILNIRFNEGITPFRLDRKIKQMTTRSNSVCRTIVSVKKDANACKTRCISVSNSDGLYLTDNFITTHNSAFYERPMKIEAALSQNTNCQIDVSTPNGMGNPFYQKRHAGYVEVFTFRWQDDPRKDQAWYDKQCLRLDPIVVAQEIDIDYAGSAEDICINGKWVRACIDIQKYIDIDKLSYPRDVGLDIAGDGKDLNAWIPRFGPVVGMPEDWSDGDTLNTADKAEELQLAHGIDVTKFDSVGIGHGVLSAFKRKTKIKTAPINSGDTPTETYWPDGKTSKEKFRNLKAEMWWTIRDRCYKTYLTYIALTTDGREGKIYPYEELIFLPDHQQLIAELSMLKYFRQETGKIIMETKKQLATRGIKSPDFADALVMAFCPVGPKDMTIRKL